MRIIRFLPVFLAVIFIFGFSYQAQAYQDFCPQHDTNTYMKRKLNKTRVFRGSIASINDYLFGHTHDPSSGGRVLAFVDYDDYLSTDFQFKYEIVELARDKYCVRMTHVNAFFIRNPQMVLPTDYKRDSCEYKEILKHEKRHVNALKRFHHEYSPRFEAHLGRVARGLPVPNPVPGDSIELVKRQLEEHYLVEFHDFLYKAAELLYNDQRKIDSPQEYRGVRRRCKDW